MEILPLALQLASEYYGTRPASICQRLGRSSAHDFVLSALNVPSVRSAMFLAEEVELARGVCAERIFNSLFVTICKFDSLVMWRLVCSGFAKKVLQVGIAVKIGEFLEPAYASLTKCLHREEIISLIRFSVYH